MNHPRKKRKEMERCKHQLENKAIFCFKSDLQQSSISIESI